MKSSIGLILSVSLALLVNVNCDIFPECEDVANPMFINVPGSCSEYIYCDGADSLRGECPEGYFFDPVNSTCDDPINVNCSSNDQPLSSTTSTTSSSAISTTQASSSSSRQSTSSSTLAPQTLPTLTTTTLSSPATTPSTTPSTNPSSICPPSNSNQPESVPKAGSCSQYYLCYNGNSILMDCPNNLEFNSLKKQCDWASEANCVANPTTTVKPIELCSNRVNAVFKYPENCHYYYRCTNGLLSVQECPVGYGWDDNRKSCTPTGCASHN